MAIKISARVEIKITRRRSWKPTFILFYIPLIPCQLQPFHFLQFTRSLACLIESECDTISGFFLAKRSKCSKDFNGRRDGNLNRINCFSYVDYWTEIFGGRRSKKKSWKILRKGVLISLTGLNIFKPWAKKIAYCRLHLTVEEVFKQKIWADSI